MARPITRSLPGMTREEKITRSPAPTETSLCSPAAMRETAEWVSPWLPVDRMTWRRAGSSPSSSRVTRRPSGTLR